jgi:hypothetical protein
MEDLFFDIISKYEPEQEEKVKTNKNDFDFYFLKDEYIQRKYHVYNIFSYTYNSICFSIFYSTKRKYLNSYILLFLFKINLYYIKYN